MKEYDVIVIGSGAGAIIAELSARRNLKTALVDKGPAGGTCLNVGCIPSKMLIAVADRIIEINDSKKFGIDAEIKGIDFEKIMKEMKDSYLPDHEKIYESLKKTRAMDFYDAEGFFVDEYILMAGNKKIKGKNIFIASGARPLIPKIKGIEGVEYLTNETVLNLKKIPKSMVIIGGGYIAVEYAHFFSAIGTKVSIIQRNKRLVPDEEEEISNLLKRELDKRMKIYTEAEAVEAGKEKDEYYVVAKKGNEKLKIKAEKIFIAAGRKSNADLLKAENSGIEIDERGYIKVNDYLETNKPNVWVIGDATGKQMFTHSSREEADIAWHNFMHGGHHKMKFDFSKVPHAIFSYPQIASIGLTEKQAKKDYDILVGKANYNMVAKGQALREKSGFAKAIVEQRTGKILGFHIIGPYAPILIQEVINAVNFEGNGLNFIFRSMHIHPEITELIQATFGRLKQV
jgi:mycothione reductase